MSQFLFDGLLHEHPDTAMATRAQILRKEQTLSSLKETRQNILAEASKLSKRQWDQVFLGSWSIKDLLAHLIGWDDTNLEAIQNVLAGKLPAFYEYRDPDWRTYNAMLVKKHKVNSSKEILTKAKDSQEKLIQFLQTVLQNNSTKISASVFAATK
jgi:hypothetical protein